MTEYVFPCQPQPSVAVSGSSLRFPVHRIYCAGSNYAGHLQQMGAAGPAVPFFFAKPADAVVASGERIPYPPRTTQLHHEIELVVAIGRGGRDIAAGDALAHVFGYAVGNDLTRRDLQLAARERREPWDMGKGFDHSACIAPIRVSERGHPNRGRIWLTVNGQLRQEADLGEMICGVPELISELSSLVALLPGDLVYTGTPAGVGALEPGDRVTGGVDGLDSLENTVG